MKTSIIVFITIQMFLSIQSSEIILARPSYVNLDILDKKVISYF